MTSSRYEYRGRAALWSWLWSSTLVAGIPRPDTGASAAQRMARQRYGG